uniref:F-box domain-containing protein n=1 Tax=Psilocybe cubensis TaxID=181762 RepID=A0A8H8CFQ3_PSICU
MPHFNANGTRTLNFINQLKTINTSNPANIDNSTVAVPKFQQSLNMIDVISARLESGTEGHDYSVVNGQCSATTELREPSPQEVASLSATINRLPTELMGEIFIRTSHTCFEEHLSMWMYRFQLPWSLSQVCRLWRNVALSLPLLWRQIPSLDLSQKHTRNLSYQEYLIEILNRSKGIAIDIHINARNANDLPHPILGILLQHCERWGRLRLEACHAIIPLLEPAKGRLTSLQRLTLIFRWDRRSPSIVPNDLFLNAPSLNDVYWEDRAGYFSFPRNQIIWYTHSTQYTNHLFEVVSHSMTSLTTLVLHSHSTCFGSFPHLVLPSLLTLDMWDHNVSCEWLLGRLTLPKLRSLSVGTNVGDVSKSVMQMIERSGLPCELEVLKMNVETYPSVSLTTLLKKTPHLRLLSIPLPPIADLRGLTCDHEASFPCLIPFLRELYFCVLYPIENISSILIKLASSRSRTRRIPISPEELRRQSL